MKKENFQTNPWAICTSSVGREDKAKYEACVLKVKKEYGLSEDLTEEDLVKEESFNTEEFKSKSKLPVYALDVTECTESMCDASEVKFIALVAKPAIEVEAHAFSEEKLVSYDFKVKDASKRLLVGPLMIPNKNIFRVNKKTGQEYYVQFSEAAIENCQKNFKKKGYGHNFNLEHNDNNIVPNTYLLSDWIIQNPKNGEHINYGFKNLPKGTWMGIMYMENQEEFDKFVESGLITGFSVEGQFLQSYDPIDYFSAQERELSDEEQMNELLDYLNSEEFNNDLSDL